MDKAARLLNIEAEAENNGSLDISYSIPNLSRIRAPKTSDTESHVNFKIQMRQTLLNFLTHQNPTPLSNQARGSK